MNTQSRTLCFAALLQMFLASFAVAANSSGPEAEHWQAHLRQAYFGDQAIGDGDGVLSLEAPKRAEDPALVPVRIQAAFPQRPDRFIESITVIIDRNPDPRAGVFNFSPRSGRADLELRLRVDQYSYVRAIARTNDGALHMVSRYVKASGGCSAPSSGDFEQAMARLGKMRLDARPSESDGESLFAAQLRVSHPNITGMQKDQQTHLIRPAHYVRQVRVLLGDEPVFWADVGISVSENPSFRFFLRADDPALLDPDGSSRALTAEVFDTKENRFVHSATLRLPL